MSWGAVNAAEVVEGAVERRFDAFIEALLDGQIVPLLGAGASRDSVPTTEELLDKLKAHIQAPFAPDGAGKGDFSRIAEALQWQHGGRAAPVCEALNISAWADAPPTRAHRYLALLACEGVISDVVTTNYDSGLEKAWRQARSLAEADWQPVNHEGALGGRRSRWGPPGLRLYKINGCANRLRDGEKEERSQEIQLTDLQLQRFGKRRWAQRIFESLFQDRQLVLSGFGSEEAQIWFVVMDILGELQGKPSARRYLWVAEYSDRIEFHLLQALVGELRVRDPNKTEICFDNVFWRDDRAFFGGECEGLDAGDFWRKVWIEALKRGITDPEGPALRKFAYAVAGAPFRPTRPEDQPVAKRWDEIVRQVFDSATLWLNEPRRADGSSRWARRDESTPPEADAPCAPGLACLELPEGHTVYRALNQAPEYWVTLILALLALPAEHGRMRGTLEDHEPCLEVRLGDKNRKITQASPSNMPGSGPAIDRTGAEGAEGKLDVTLTVKIDLLAALKSEWNVADCIARLGDAVAQILHYPLQNARKSEFERREARRDRGGTP